MPAHALHTRRGMVPAALACSVSVTGTIPADAPAQLRHLAGLSPAAAGYGERMNPAPPCAAAQPEPAARPCESLARCRAGAWRSCLGRRRPVDGAASATARASARHPPRGDHQHSMIRLMSHVTSILNTGNESATYSKSLQTVNESNPKDRKRSLRARRRIPIRDRRSGSHAAPRKVWRSAQDIRRASRRARTNILISRVRPARRLTVQ